MINKDRNGKLEIGRRKKVIFILFPVFCLLSSIGFAQEQDSSVDSEQQINDFSLAGYGEKGQKTWDLSGKSADIFDDLVKLKDIEGNLYGEKEEIVLTADEGAFNKSDGNIHLQENVIVTTSSGAKLTTDSLDWNRKENLVSTKDEVNIEKENMVTTALGATGLPNLNKVNLEKNVKVEMNQQGLSGGERSNADEGKTVITCDGPLEIEYEKNIAIFKNNVKVDRDDSQIYSDNMEVHFLSGEKGVEDNNNPSVLGANIKSIIAEGNARIVRGENVSYSDKVIYSNSDKKITLLGKPRLVIYSTEDFKNASAGN